MAFDLCVGFLIQCWKEFQLFDFPQNAQILEIGCGETDTAGAIRHERPDVRVIGIDWCDAQECTAHEQYRGNAITTQKFAGRQFDAVISVSAIEHIGLGGYGDPHDPDGDITVMRRIGTEWLKPGGFCYLDVPFRDNGVFSIHGNRFRAYDKQRLNERLIQPSGLKKLADRHFPGDHPDGPYIALVLRK